MIRKNKQKTIIIIFIFSLILIVGIISAVVWNEYKKEQQEDAEALTLKENLTTEFLSTAKVSDFISELKGTLINDYDIETSTLGTKKIEFDYKSIRNKNKTKSFEIEIVDTTKPEIFLSNTITLKKGESKKLEEIIFSGDNCDSNPERTIEGEYDLNTVGKYNLIYSIKDSSGNVASKNFTLNVVEKYSTTTATKSNVDFKNAISTYKNANTRLGIDVSQWQGDIDWEKVKKAGAEFAIIRIGYQKGYGGDIIIDPYFIKNIEGARKVGLDIGTYFYSYAITKDEAEEQANWVIDTIKPYGNLDLPISFDWESWSSFSTCKMSFYDINQLANTYIKVCNQNGYEGSLYSSKNYLESIWYGDKYNNVWLANYTNKTAYKGKYQIWQFCNTGRIDGINGDVDIDVLYK